MARFCDKTICPDRPKKIDSLFAIAILIPLENRSWSALTSYSTEQTYLEADEIITGCNRLAFFHKLSI